MRKHLSSCLCVFVFLSSCGRNKQEPEAEPVVTVDVAPVLNSSIQLKVNADSVLFPLQQAAIVPKISAPVKRFYVEKGAHVRAGQLLAELENQDLAGAAKENQAALAQADAAYQTTARATLPEEVHKAELDVRAAKEASDAQQKIYESRQELFKQGAIAQKDVNDSLVNVTQARNQYEIARKRLEDLQGFATDQSLKSAAALREAARAKYESAQAQLSYSRITSPINGVVTDRPLYAGEMSPGGAPIITVMDMSQVIARAHISQDEAAQLKIGDPANLISSDATVLFPGKVTQISPALDPSSTTVEVWVQAPNPSGRLRAGSSMRLEIIAKTVPGALVIPQSAVLTSSSGNTSVIVIDSENKPQKKSVSLGIREGANVQVTDGLESGERVVTTGAFELAKLDPDVLAKTKVQIAPPKEEADDEK